MKEIREEQCYWHDAARRSIDELELRNTYNSRGCYTCSGKNKNCSHYVPIIKTWPIKQDTWPYEQILRDQNEQRNKR